MYVIDVIPLSKGPALGSLSYRSKKRLLPGTLAYVPLRSKNVPALVVNVSSVVESKASLKAAGFALRGGTLTSAGTLPESVIAAAKEIAAYHATSLGNVLASLLKDILPEELPKSFSEGPGYKERFVEDAYQKRIEAYRALVRKQADDKKATLIIAPTVVEAERLYERLAEDAAVLLTGTIRGKKRANAIRTALSAKGAVIATPAFAWLPMQHTGAVVIERPSANGYVLPKRPYVDVRRALAELAKHRGFDITYGDTLLPIELRPQPDASLRASFTTPAMLIDPRIEQKEKAFAALPEEMLRAIVETHQAGGRNIILAVRKGYGSAVVCRDCGNIVRDERGVPLSLATLGKARVLRSADGITKANAEALCSLCGSWNLISLGIGVERVEEEVKKALHDAAIIRFDADTIRTSAEAKAAVKRMSEKGAIVIGTEIALPFLDPAHPFETGAIASADSLLALPFWRARERLVRLGLTLRERAERIFIATRVPEEIAMDAILHPERETFFKEEASIRKALSYPPFGHLLVFHAEGTKGRIDEASAAIGKLLEPIPCTRLADRIVARGRMRLSLVAKLKGGAWPDAELSLRLARLPFSISLHIDPESLW